MVAQRIAAGATHHLQKHRKENVNPHQKICRVAGCTSIAKVWSWNVWNEDPKTEGAFAITTHYEPIAVGCGCGDGGLRSDAGVVAKKKLKATRMAFVQLLFVAVQAAPLPVQSPCFLERDVHCPDWQW